MGKHGGTPPYPLLGDEEGQRGKKARAAGREWESMC